MKIKIILLLGVALGAIGQTNIKGLKYFGVGGGVTGLGYFPQLSFHRVMAKNINMEIGLNNEFGKFKTVSFNVAQIYGGVDYYFFKIKDKHFFKIGGGLFGEFNSLKNITESDNIKKNSVNYGPYALIGVDLGLNSKIFLTPFYRQNFALGKPMGNYYFQTGLTLKFKLR